MFCSQRMSGSDSPLLNDMPLLNDVQLLAERWARLPGSRRWVNKDNTNSCCGRGVKIHYCNSARDFRHQRGRAAAFFFLTPLPLRSLIRLPSMIIGWFIIVIGWLFYLLFDKIFRKHVCTLPRAEVSPDIRSFIYTLATMVTETTWPNPTIPLRTSTAQYHPWLIKPQLALSGFHPSSFAHR